MNSGTKCFGRVIAALIIPLVLISGCAVGPDYIRPSAPEPQEWIEKDDPRLSDRSADLSQWWTVFNDPVLNSLIEKAFQQNLPLRIAGLRIMEARAELGIVIGNQYPQLQQFRGDLTRTSASEHTANTQPIADFNFYSSNIGFDAAWEMDFWGRFRRAVDSGVWNLDASVAAYDDILVTLTAEVARTYILIRTLQTRLTIARENVKIQKRSLEIAEVRFKGGDVTELDVTQSRALLGSTQASIPRIEARLRQAENALAVLLGRLPEDVVSLLSDIRPIPQAPDEVAVGLPAELLRRRPDIRAAEGQMAAQCSLIGVAKADLYPHFSLFGSVGLSASDAALTAAGFPGGSSLGDLWDSDAIEVFGGLSFGWDVFNYGRLKNRVRVQDARFQQLVVNYKNTVLRAAQEVEDGVAAFLNTRDEVQELSVSVAAASRSVDLASIQYREGLVDYQRVIDSQRFLAQIENLHASREGAEAQSLVAIYKALGGGWEIREGKDFVPEETKETMGKRTDWGDLLSPEKMKIAPAEEEVGQWHGPYW
jgi:NodT family efflux transporter outer membrane factor (OMF) lipoprotein